MVFIYIYGFSGKYIGSPEYDYQHPAPGARHNCMLFLRQDDDAEQLLSAEAECKKYGFGELSFVRSGKLDMEVLNTNAFRGFAGFYEEALETGSSLLYHPNS